MHSSVGYIALNSRQAKLKEADYALGQWVKYIFFR